MSRHWPLTAARLADAAGGRVIAGDPDRVLARLSIDSRTLAAGEAFVAIRGPRFDGHDFLREAVARGASALVVDRAAAVDGWLPAGLTVVLAGDTVRALQDAARQVRHHTRARVVAITGSAGKTTTKELAAAVAATRFRTLRNEGNLNNHIGLPLSLLGLQDGYEVAVVEFGMNHAGELRQLVAVATPDVRVWTNVGTAHIEFFGSQDAIAEAKAEILEGATRDTVFVANADDPRVLARVRGFPGPTITFALAGGADVHPVSVQQHGVSGTGAHVRTPHGEMSLALALPGRANLANALAAIAVGLALGVPIEAMGPALREAKPAARRGELRHGPRDVLVYDDCYNASPDALEQALDTVAADGSGRRRVAFLGEMLELGEAADALHRRCGRAAARAGVAELITVGGPAAQALGAAAVAEGVPAARAHHFATSAEAADAARDIVAPGDLVLVKGSRGTRMERVVERLQGGAD